MAVQVAGRGDYPVCGTNRDAAGRGAGGRDVVRGGEWNESNNRT